MKYVAILDTNDELSEEAIEQMKNAVFPVAMNKPRGALILQVLRKHQVVDAI